MKYERPTIIAMNGTAEGVFLASGEEEVVRTCQSKYMNGTYQTPNPGGAEGETYTYGSLGCRSCPADLNWACALQTGGGLSSDTLPLMPQWENEGHAPTDTYVNSNFNTFEPS